MLPWVRCPKYLVGPNRLESLCHSGAQQQRNWTRYTKNSFQRYFSTSSITHTSNNDLRNGNKISIAIVGSGPSGCYTAKYLLKAFHSGNTEGRSSPPTVSVQQIDIIERLPTPYGLVRYGVAPDHPDVKNVQNDFDRLFESAAALKDSTDQDGGPGGDSVSNNNNIPVVNFLGNVHVGVNVSLAELRERYDIVILSYGCQSDRKLNIDGEDRLHGILSAREFVAWYNGTFTCIEFFYSSPKSNR
jgi:NADPH-dependent glutamate synthase beta subunit-like oxidoreductase